MSEELTVSRREWRGTSRSRRQRAAGNTPAVLYGHGESTVSLSVPSMELAAVLRHGAHLVALKGELDENALITDIQWDPLGAEVLHLDLTRVSLDEKVEISLSVELRGEAPGTKQGGIVELVTHEVEIECPVQSIPEHLEISINDLQLEGEILAEALHLPPNAKLITPADTVIVHCVEPAPEVEVDLEAGPGATEPELVNKKDESEEEEDGN